MKTNVSWANSLRNSPLPFLILLLMGLMLSCQQAPAPSLEVMTFNIRWASPDDGHNVWANRRSLVLETLRNQAPDIVGFQEVLKSQLDDLTRGLPGYAWQGLGREDGKEGGEYAPLFFKADRFEAIDFGTFWLSDEPEIPGSVGWDAALPRIATWAKLVDKLGGDTLLACNAHFDHIGKRARAESARLILDFLVKQGSRLPLVLLGDFNVTPDEVPYRIMAAELRDGRELSTTAPQGPPRTFNYWGREEGAVVIDHLFFSPHWQIDSFAVLEVIQDSLYLSDHWPVVTSGKLIPRN